MGRKCSCCGTTGHNSRTCPTQRRRNAARMKLFGVQLLDQSPFPSSSNNLSMKKSFSLDCLSVSQFNAPSGSRTPSCSPSPQDHVLLESSGYLSDGLIQTTQEKKKGEMSFFLFHLNPPLLELTFHHFYHLHTHTHTQTHPLIYI